MNNLCFVKLSSNAQTPTKASKFSADFDLKSAYKAIVPARVSALLYTDIQIKLPHNIYGMVELHLDQDLL